jgi:hypothetical protein
MRCHNLVCDMKPTILAHPAQLLPLGAFYPIITGSECEANKITLAYDRQYGDVPYYQSF